MALILSTADCVSRLIRKWTIQISSMPDRSGMEGTFARSLTVATCSRGL